jgi:hypothetical protein
MFLVAHACYPAPFFAGLVTGALLAAAYLLMRILRRRS